MGRDRGAAPRRKGNHDVINKAPGGGKRSAREKRERREKREKREKREEREQSDKSLSRCLPLGLYTQSTKA